MNNSQRGLDFTLKIVGPSDVVVIERVAVGTMDPTK